MQNLLKRPSSSVSILMDALEGRRMFAFGVTSTTGSNASFIADNGTGLVVSILKNGASVTSTKHLGDMTSLKLNGTEVLASYAAANSRYSHYEQGLTGEAIISVTQDPSATPQWIKITCDDTAATSGAVIQTYVIKRGDSNLYLTSLPIDVTNGPGEGRYLAYLDRTKFTNIEAPSDNAQSNGTVEGSDVFYNTTTGITTSKFYNPTDRRMIDNIVHGVSGPGIGAYMYMGNREHSAGGPFFKDIDFQSGSATEIYNCIFTGHTQTETYRQGLHVYALQLTTGAAPVAPNYSFLEGLNISGLVPASARGAIAGTASGVAVGHESVVTLSNSTEQYWTKADTTTGAYSITGVMPGTYTETLYDNELAIGTRTVTITAGNTAAYNIASTYYTPAATWRVGTWDGTPKGFLNADKLASMHPSDTRMASWVLAADATTGVPTFTVGTNTDAQWPLGQFMGVNNSNRIAFTLTAAQAAVAQTVRIGVTLGFEGGRNRITVNSGNTGVTAYTSAIPTATRDLNSRGITRGTWRGDNTLYTYNLPTSALKAGLNWLDLGVVSGSYVAGQTWLSPNVAYDAIDMVPTASASTATIASVTLTPVGNIGVNGTRAFTAVAKDSAGNVITGNLDWSAALGTIDSNGNYIAPATPGKETITVTAIRTRTAGYSVSASSSSAVAATITGTASTTFNVLTATPGVATAAVATPNPTANRKTTLSVLGADLTGEANLKYTWSVVGTPPGTVTFSANGTNAAKSSVATFSAFGSYTLRATITNATNLSITSDVTVNVLEKAVWYRVNESSGTTLVDSSGANNTATLNGSYAYAPGIDSNAIQLTGGYAKLPNGIVSGLDDFTVGTWVKPDSLGVFSRIFDFGSSSTSYMFLTPASSFGGGIRFAIKNGSAAEQQINGPALTAGVWSHVVVTLVGNVATLYVNGVAVGTNNAMTLHPAALGTTTNNLIGDSQFAADPALLATIDDFRVYGSGLSAANVNAWYKSGFAPTVTGTVINDGSDQRSSVKSMTITFDQAVTLDASDLVLQLDGVATGTALTVTPTSAANTSYIVTFSGAGTTYGSLVDGRYTLSLVGSSITNSAGIAMASSPSYNFFRFFGDTDGNAAVDFNDFIQLQTSFGLSSGTTGYFAGLDSDGNNVIDFNDFIGLQVNYGTSI